MPYPNEHAARVRDPEDFVKESIRSSTLKGGVRLLSGHLKGGDDSMVAQAYRFPVDLFTAEEAKAWLRRNDVKYISFEPATGEKKAQKCCKTGDCSRKVQKSESSKHDAILQVLNRTVGKYFFTAEPFEATVDTWAGVPIIFSERPPNADWPIGVTSLHPEWKPYSMELTDEAIRAINGAVVGEIQNPEINPVGRKKLMGETIFSDEKARELLRAGKISEETFAKTEAALRKVQKFIEEGKLSHSTGFTAPHTNEGALYKAVIPNHLLVFEEDDKNFPIDRGAVILNKNTEVSMTEGETVANSGRVISAKNFGKLQTIYDAFSDFIHGVSTDVSNKVDAPAITTNTTSENVYATGTSYPGVSFGIPKDTGGNPNETDQRDTMTEELQRKLDEAIAAGTEKDAQIASFKEQLAAQTAEIEGFRKAQKDAEWAGIKSKLPPGLIHKPEDESALREMFETNHAQFSNKILDIKTMPPTEESGENVANKEKPENDPVAIATELRTITGRMPRG